MRDRTPRWGLGARHEGDGGEDFRAEEEGGVGGVEGEFEEERALDEDAVGVGVLDEEFVEDVEGDAGDGDLDEDAGVGFWDGPEDFGFCW